VSGSGEQNTGYRPPVDSLDLREFTLLHRLVGSNKLRLVPTVSAKIGGVSRAQLVSAVQKVREVTDRAMTVIHQPSFHVSARVETVNFIELTLEQMGFLEPQAIGTVLTSQFVARWSKENLDRQILRLCLPEDAPSLGLVYDKQPAGRAVWLAQERISLPNIAVVLMKGLPKGDGHQSRPPWLEVRTPPPDLVMEVVKSMPQGDNLPTWGPHILNLVHSKKGVKILGADWVRDETLWGLKHPMFFRLYDI
jgi:hypothetical protein